MSGLQHKAVFSVSDTYGNSKLSGCAGEYKYSVMLFAFSLVSLRGQVNQDSLIIVPGFGAGLFATTLSNSTSLKGYQQLLKELRKVSNSKSWHCT